MNFEFVAYYLYVEQSNYYNITIIKYVYLLI
jgi:hypothetical protein